VCEPLTILSAVSGTASAVGGLASAGAQKKAEVNNYKRQLKIREIEWDRSRATYAQKVSEAKEQLDENFMAASRGFAAEQSQLNALYNQASVQLQDDFIKIAQSQKYYGSGKTAKRLAARDMAAFGRSQALTASNLVRAGESYDTDVANIRQQLKSANRKTVAPVMFKPQPGRPPVKPNVDMTGANLAFLGSMAGTAFNAASTFKEFGPSNTGSYTSHPSGFSFSQAGQSAYQYQGNMPSFRNYNMFKQ